MPKSMKFRVNAKIKKVVIKKVLILFQIMRFILLMWQPSFGKIISIKKSHQKKITPLV